MTHRWKLKRQTHSPSAGCTSGERSEGGVRGTGWAALAGSSSGSPRRAGGQPGTFLFGAGRSGSCAGVARTLLISQCWDGASWARRGGGGGRPQPVPGGGGSSSSRRGSSSTSSSRSGRPAGLPLCLAPRVPSAWRAASRAPSFPPSLLPSARPAGSRPAGWEHPAAAARLAAPSPPGPGRWTPALRWAATSRT